MIDGRVKEDNSMNEDKKIIVIGVGGAGNNLINHMLEIGVSDVEYIAMNTDNQDLFTNKADKTIQLGMDLTRGLGAGGNPEIGARAAEESRNEIVEAIKDAKMVFVAAGMGGGTGTGAAPVVSKIAKDMGILTIAFVTTPFNYEGRKRRRFASEGIDRLKESVDCYIVVPNEKINELVEEDTTAFEAFRMSDNVLSQGVYGLSRLLLSPGNVNLDFNDITSVMRDKGLAYLSVGQAEGKNAVETATKRAITNPLIEEQIAGATTGLISIHTSGDVTFRALSVANTIFGDILDEEADIYNGHYVEENIEDGAFVTVIVTGIDKKEEIFSARDFRTTTTLVEQVQNTTPEEPFFKEETPVINETKTYEQVQQSEQEQQFIQTQQYADQEQFVQQPQINNSMNDNMAGSINLINTNNNTESQPRKRKLKSIEIPSVFDKN